MGGRQKEKPRPLSTEACTRDEEKSRQRPTLPPGYPDSTIGAGGLNGRVRNGNGCDPSAMVTGINYQAVDTEDSGPRQERVLSCRAKRPLRVSGRINVMVKPHDRLVPVS